LQHYRNLNIENITNTLNTIKKNTILVDAKNKLVDGISIFCDWETSSNEWSKFRDSWVEN
jgi:hypothetical protein